MRIESAGVPSVLLPEYAGIPIAFEVRSIVTAQWDGQSYVLTEHRVTPPYVKDYDIVGDRPQGWADRFDTSQWVMWLARAGGRCVGGATLALGGSGLDMLEGRSDLGALWDIRVEPTYRGTGVGRALFAAAEARARARGCVELKVETQNVNVPACRFYAALGCELRLVQADAYPECPGEARFLWYKPLLSSAEAAG